MRTQPSPVGLRRSYFYGLSWLLSLGLFMVFSRLVFLQVIQHQTWLKKAEHYQEKRIPLHTERGTIYDRNGRILAMSIERPSLYAVPSQIKDWKAFSRRLAPLLGLSRKKILHRLQIGGREFAWLQRKLRPEVREAVEASGIEAVGFVTESLRVYPKRSLAGQVLGFVGIDNEALGGIEVRYDSILKGRKGWLVVQKDRSGKPLFPKDFKYIRPSPGYDLKLTLDEVIQHISERELDRIVQETGAAGGTVIVMAPDSGEILAMAVAPRFDPNRYRNFSSSKRQNRAITHAYEPGSTFKLVTAAAALEENLVFPEDLIDCEEGLYRVKGGAVHDHDAIGVIPFYQVIARSSNIGTIKVAEVLGRTRLASYIQAFGFGRRLGIGLPGESPGLLRNPEAWSGRSLASISIGQEIGVTPLQMVTAASVLANGGRLKTPRIIQEDSGEDAALQEQLRKKRGPLNAKRVISERVASVMTQILRTVVSEKGTARRAAVPGFSVAGKTGTAQKFDREAGRYSKDKYVSSFVGFVPAEDPALTILVAVDEPKGVAWGGEIAAPVFSRIAQAVLRYLKVPPRTEAEPPYFQAAESAQPGLEALRVLTRPSLWSAASPLNLKPRAEG